MGLNEFIENVIVNEIKKKKLTEARFILPKHYGKNFKHFTIAKELGLSKDQVLTDIPFKLLYKKQIKAILKHKVYYDTFIRQINAARIINKGTKSAKTFTKLMRYLQKWYIKLPLSVRRHLNEKPLELKQ